MYLLRDGKIVLHFGVENKKVLEIKSTFHLVEPTRASHQIICILSSLGVAALEVPPIEPMKISSVVVTSAGSTSSFNLRSSFKDARIHGLSTSSVVRTAVKFKKFQMKTDAYTRRMDFEGKTANLINNIK